MTASTALTITPPLTQLPAPSSLQEVQSYAKLFADSRMFTDIEEMAQAAVKIIAGGELGVKPFQSMNGLHIIKGKTTLSAGLMATLVKRSGRYNYRVLEHTDTICRIAFFEHGEPCGESSFSLDDAKKANLLGNPMWQKYAKNMLFARTMSNGVRWYAADVFGGPVYTPEELGANVDAEGEVIDLPANPAPAPKAQTQATAATTSQDTATTSQDTAQTTEEPAPVTTQEAKKPTPAQIATAAAKQEFTALAAEYGIVVSELPRENAVAWLETLYMGKPEKYDAATWTKLASGLKAVQDIAPGIAPDVVLSYASGVWPEIGSLLQMSESHWKGVAGLLEDEQAQANHLKETAAAPAPLVTVEGGQSAGVGAIIG